VTFGKDAIELFFLVVKVITSFGDLGVDFIDIVFFVDDTVF
jgi:hypothetical protein